MSNGRICRPQAGGAPIASPIPPELGKIKVGIKSEQGYPKSLDYFVATGKYASAFNAVYEHASTILVYFPSDDPALVCNESYVYRDANGKKIAQGDGETFQVFSTKTQSRITISTRERPNIMEEIEQKYPSQKGWEVTLTLRFVCPLVNKIYGVWRLETKGAASSIPQIRDTFDAMLQKNGKISGVLCDLNVGYAKSDSPRVSRYPVISLVPNESQENVEKVQALTRNILEK